MDVRPNQLSPPRGYHPPLMSSQPEEFTITVSERDDRVVVVPRGELDILGAPELESTVLRALHEGLDVELRLDELDFMDSSGVRVLVAGHAAAQLDGSGALTIVNAQAGTTVARILEVSGVGTGLGLLDPGAGV